MGYYYIKNIKIDKKNNKISADLADSNLEPIKYFHCDNLCDKESFEDKYANFIYNVVVGNYHPTRHNNYHKIMMNFWLNNYYDDARDIGKVETYNKYKEVIDGILANNQSKIRMLESDRKINPEKYYCLKPIELNVKYDGKYYCNQMGEVYNYNDGKLEWCDNRINNYGCPIRVPYDIDEFIKYNDFLSQNKIEESVEL